MKKQKGNSVRLRIGLVQWTGSCMPLLKQTTKCIGSVLKKMGLSTLRSDKADPRVFINVVCDLKFGIAYYPRARVTEDEGHTDDHREGSI